MNTPVLEVTNLSKNFGGLRALNEVDLTINRQEIVALIGPNGAGKTTFFNCITGIYLRITFLGAPFTFFYNALAAGLKSVGDSKTPLKFLAFSAVLNAVLDLILIGGLGFGIVCSAVTTVVAEAASALLAAVYMARRVPELCPGHGQWRIRRDLLGPILRYGAVTAVQQAVQPICKVLIQGQVNALGVGAIAAFNAVTRVDDFAFTPEQSIATAITTYIAQNRGAGQTARIRCGFAVGLRLELGYWLLMGSLTLLLRRGILSLFVAGEGAADVIALGSTYLGWMAVFYALPALTNGFQGFYRGMGKMTTTLIGTCLQAGLRAAAAAVPCCRRKGPKSLPTARPAPARAILIIPACTASIRRPALCPRTLCGRPMRPLLARTRCWTASPARTGPATSALRPPPT